MFRPRVHAARAFAHRAPYADLLWAETSGPDLEEARAFAEAIHDRFPGKMLAYNCSPSFNWRKKLDAATIARFQKELADMGYKFQFVTLTGFHALNYSMFELAQGYAATGMTAYSELQQAEFTAKARGYEAIEHQSRWRGVFRRGSQGHFRRDILDACHGRLHRAGAVPGEGPGSLRARGAPRKPGREPLRSVASFGGLAAAVA